MRFRVMVLLGVLLAIGIGIVWLWPELPTPTVVYRNLASLAAIGLGTYAVVCLLIPAAFITMDLWRVRARLESLVSPNRQVWDTAFSGTSLTRIGLRLIEFAPDGNADPENQVLVRSRLGPAESRREIRGVYWDWLVRLQCLTAIAALVAILGFSLANSYAAPVPHPQSVGLPQLVCGELLAIAFLGFVGLAAISWAVEPFLDAIAGVPVVFLDTALLHALGSGSAGVPAPITNLLASLLERDQKTLSEALSRLAESSELLSAIAQAGPRTNAPVEPGNLEAFTSAIDRLSAAIERAMNLPLATAAITQELPSERPAQQGDFSRDLRAILKELD